MSIWLKLSESGAEYRKRRDIDKIKAGSAAAMCRYFTVKSDTVRKAVNCIK